MAECNPNPKGKFPLVLNDYVLPESLDGKFKAKCKHCNKVISGTEKYPPTGRNIWLVSSLSNNSIITLTVLEIFIIKF